MVVLPYAHGGEDSPSVRAVTGRGGALVMAWLLSILGSEMGNDQRTKMSGRAGS